MKRGNFTVSRRARNRTEPQRLKFEIRPQVSRPLPSAPQAGRNGADPIRGEMLKDLEAEALRLYLRIRRLRERAIEEVRS